MVVRKHLNQGLTIDAPPVGSVIAWGTTGDVPTGYLECDGSLYDVTDYEELIQCNRNTVWW